MRGKEKNSPDGEIKPQIGDPDDMLRSVGLDPDQFTLTNAWRKTQDISLHIRPNTATWQQVHEAQPVVIQGSSPAKKKTREGKVALILPDPQIGYRYYQDTQEYDPFHDEEALNIAYAVAGDINPDVVVWLGDFLDLPSFSRFEQEAAFAAATQKAIDYGHKLLSEWRWLLPDTEMVLLEGNHDRRLEKSIVKSNMSAAGIRRAGAEDEWPVLSLPHLLRLGDLGVNYVGGYPAGSYWINDRLKCIHGSTVRSAGSTAKAVVDQERVSVIFGHIHRIETQYKTVDVREGGKTRLAHTPGCLCRIDGAVPSLHGSTDLSQRPVERYENWQQGLSVVHYDSGDAPFSIESVFINTTDGYRTQYRDSIYSA